MMSSPHLKKYVGYLGESKLKKCRNCWLLQEVTISENWPSCSEGSRSTSSKQPEVSQGRAARQHGCARERRGPPPTLKAYVSEAMIYFPKHIPKKNHLDGFASSQQNNIILPSSFTTQNLTKLELSAQTAFAFHKSCLRMFLVNCFGNFSTVVQN